MHTAYAQAFVVFCFVMIMFSNFTSFVWILIITSIPKPGKTLSIMKGDPGACPTKEISIKCQILSKQICWYFLLHLPDHKYIFNIPGQQSCLWMYKMPLWLDKFSSNHSDGKLNRIPNLIELSWVGRAPILWRNMRHQAKSSSESWILASMLGTSRCNLTLAYTNISDGNALGVLTPLTMAHYTNPGTYVSISMIFYA